MIDPERRLPSGATMREWLWLVAAGCALLFSVGVGTAVGEQVGGHCFLLAVVISLCGWALHQALSRFVDAIPDGRPADE